MPLTIRVATQKDFPQLVVARLAFMEALWNKPVEEAVKTNGRRRLPEQFKEMMANNLYCFLAEVDGQIVCVAYFYILEFLFHPKLPTGHFGRISNVYTPPEHRHRGYARAVMEHIIDFARSRHLDSITLDASDAAKPLYEALGFVEDNLDQHLPMTLRLTC